MENKVEEIPEPKIVEINDEQEENKVEELNDSDTDSFHSAKETFEEEQKDDKSDSDPAPPAVDGTKETEDIPIVENKESDMVKAQDYKVQGNEMYKAEEYLEALDFYNKAIYYCPDEDETQLAIFYHNKGMTLCKMGRNDEALKAFECAINHNKDYLKARWHKLRLHKEKEEYTEAKEEAKIIFEKNPKFNHIAKEMQELEKLEKEKLDKMKDEVLGNLKSLGNSILGKFGMSLDNFKLNQNSDGTYNVSMGQ
ncbi:unnamed protein product [Moneuplotes crassus]|uniref:Tetratricopeptide repeat protein n=1 Tax=Euplotes crassus TaxID=5936 RepID=A0AAD1XTM5_EUPCR|nr:unnamed protein product [Moneuplotes crassus]